MAADASIRVGGVGMQSVKRGIDVIGVPMDLGAGRRGVDMGPSAVRTAQLGARLRALGFDVVDRGDIPVQAVETQAVGRENCRYLASITEACTKLCDSVADILVKERTPLIIGGDHSINAGTMAGYKKVFGERKQNVGLIWIDAHADMNTPETSPSGNIHGMPLAIAIGQGPKELTDLGASRPHVDPADVVLIGIRDVDDREKEAVWKSGIRAFSMRDIDERGLADIMREAVRIVRKDNVGFHVSLDADGLDPEIAPGVGTPVKGGISYREAHLMMEVIADSGGMLGFEVVEVNPLLDENNRTAEVVVELALSAFGKTIL